MSASWDFALSALMMDESNSFLFNGTFDEFRFDGGGFQFPSTTAGLHQKRRPDETICKVESSKRANNTVDRKSSFCDDKVDAGLGMMEEIHSCRVALQNRLEACVSAQRSLDLSDQDGLSQHRASLRELHRSIVLRKAWIIDTLAMEVWRPSALVALKLFSAGLLELQTSVELCTEELASPSTSSSSSLTLSRLVIVSQDCGRPVLQGEVMGPVVLAVVSSPRSVGWPTSSHVSVRTVGADGSEMDLKLKHAPFATTTTGLHAVQITCPSLILDKTTRSKTVWLQFSAASMKSNLSQPVVVISSKKQKFDALATLLVQDLFVDPTSILPRNTVANALQLAYLQSTGQDASSDAARSLSADDLKHVFEVALGSGVFWISQPQFMKVWEWFGGMLNFICYDKHTMDMWTRGTIMGLVSKEQASDILRRQDEKRAFVLRFSSQQPGTLAVAWKDANSNGEVKHYAITKNDVNVSCSLARFLDEKQCLGWVVQAVPSFETPARWRMEEKAKALGKFFQPPRPKKFDGYEDIL